jgi:soluble lytic murein transglycosylase-like protein
MQIRYGTWRQTTQRLYGYPLPFQRAYEARLNIAVGQAYLTHLSTYLRRHRDLWQEDERTLLLACYNAGPSRTRRAGFALHRLPYRTQSYVRRICQLHDHYRAQYAQLRHAAFTQKLVAN